MSLNQRQWDILCSLQSSDKPLGVKKIAQRVAQHQKAATDKSFREMIARDLRDLKKITGAIQSKKVLISDNREESAKTSALGYLENVYSWDSELPEIAVKSLSTAQSVALGVLQKVALGLVPKGLVDELAPLFTAIHKNELVKNQDDKDLGKKVPSKVVLASEQKWLKKIAILSETVGFVAPQASAEVEKQVHEALYQEKLIEIQYRDKEFVVKPLALVQRGVRRYLIGIKRGYGTDPAFFTIARIKEVKNVHVLDYNDVKGGEDFDLDVFLKKGLAYPVFDEDILGETINLKLWVDEGTYGWISETPLDVSQTAKKVKDGYELTLTTTLREELVFWILSMANHVRVVSPKVLKDRVADDLKKAASLY